MTNIEKFDYAFTEVFGVEKSVLTDSFTKDNVDVWDSVHQLNIISILEEYFDIMFDPEDIMELTSYENAKQLMEKYGVDL